MLAKIEYENVVPEIREHGKDEAVDRRAPDIRATDSQIASTVVELHCKLTYN
jgi:hypothetical protein